MSIDVPRDLLREEAIRLYKANVRQSDIGPRIGVPIPTVRQWLVIAGLVKATAEPAVSPQIDRDPCPRCAVRKDIGCRHFPLAPTGAVSIRDQAEALFAGAR